jgi:small-conductance mechanosensitive channel
MSELLSGFQEIVTPERVFAFLRALLLLIVGWFAARGVAAAVGRVVRGRAEPQQAQLIRRAVYYPLLLLFLAAALHQVGFNLGLLIGAAGVLTVALGFASQTSASNVISGLFLMIEQPFTLGDVVQIGGTTGEVLSIDLLSVKLRMFNNTYVRVPNESVIKSEVRTLTRFPIRRLDMKIGVSYVEDLEKVRRILLELVERNPLGLEQPAPQIFLEEFGASSVDLQYSVWATKENYVALKNSLMEEVKMAFDAEGIEIPFPQRGLSPSKGGAAIPVRLVGGVDESSE